MKFDHILLPTDFSAGSKKIAQQGIDLAKKFNSRLTFVHVLATDDLVNVYGGGAIPTINYLDDLQNIAEKQLDDFIKDLNIDSSVKTAGFIKKGTPSEAVCEFAQGNDVDLILVATHGRKGVPRFFLGSVTERIVRNSQVPVLTYRLPEES